MEPNKNIQLILNCHSLTELIRNVLLLAIQILDEAKWSRCSTFNRGLHRFTLTLKPPNYKNVLLSAWNHIFGFELMGSRYFQAGTNLHHLLGHRSCDFVPNSVANSTYLCIIEVSWNRRLNQFAKMTFQIKLRTSRIIRSLADSG